MARPRFVNVDRNTPLLLAPDLRDWVPEDDLVHFVIEAVERLPLSSFRVNLRGSGSTQFPPHMMLALLIYCYANGTFSSRKIERATHRDIAVRYLTADTHPDHDTIAKFRRENLPAIQQAFLEVLLLAKELKLLKLGEIAVDGTHIKASASIDKNLTWERAQELKTKLQADIAELMKRAESADTNEQDNQSLPEEIARRQSLSAKMDQAIAELETRAAAQQARDQKQYQSKLQARAQKQQDNDGKPPRGPQPKPPGSIEEIARKRGEQANLTDPDSRLMRKNKRSGYTQSYNAQLSVDTGSYLIVGTHLSQSAGDARQLEPSLAQIDPRLGQITRVLADAGYLNAEAIERIELGNQERPGIEACVSAHREDAHSEREYDYRPPQRKTASKKEHKDPRLIAMAEKLSSEEGKAIYKKRASTVETVNGLIKSVLGKRELLLRGLEKANGEWKLTSLAHNLKRLHRLKQESSAKAPAPVKKSSHARGKSTEEPPSAATQAARLVKLLKTLLHCPQSDIQAHPTPCEI